MIMIVPLMFQHDTYPDYYDTITPRSFGCDIYELPDSRNTLKWWLHCFSFQTTGYSNALIMPFGIAIIPLVYFLGYYLTDDRMIGIISMLALTSNPIYTNWNATGTYDQMWSFFLLLSIVLLFKNTKVSFTTWFIACLSKSMAIMYFPMWFYSLWKLKQDRNMILISALLFTLGIVIVLHMELIPKIIGSGIQFQADSIDIAVTRNLSVFMDIIPGLAIASVISCFFVPRTKVKNKRLVALWMIFTFVSIPLIHLFTFQETYTYRYVPFAAFMSIFISMVIVELGNFVVEHKLATRIN